MLTLLFAFAAGLLTSLSPCVLPALPIVVGSAGLRHRAGPLALAAGLVLSFVVVGVALASGGQLLGLDGDWLRRLAAIGLLAAGSTLLIPHLQDRFTLALAPLAGWAARKSGSVDSDAGWGGQLGLGALLGLVWSPCTGPTLGAAVGLAAQGGVGRAAAVMLVFGVGAALPLLGAAYAARAFRDRLTLLRTVGGSGKLLLGTVLVVVGAAVGLGWDKRVEAWLLTHLPAGWIDLITRF